MYELITNIVIYSVAVSLTLWSMIATSALGGEKMKVLWLSRRPTSDNFQKLREYSMVKFDGAEQVSVTISKERKCAINESIRLPRL